MTSGLLAELTGPDDVKALPEERLADLCAEIRYVLLDYGHWHGGHIGSNLGMVEATVALHRVFDSPRDRIVFDVSHQAYVHKMLTGRAWAYLDPARADEVSGFTDPAESAHDQFELGHTGTSLSLACGLAKARDMAAGASNGDASIGNVVAVIGDGSLSSGVAFEGLNNIAAQGGNLIVVFNDNEMSIAGDFGGMYGPLSRLRASNGTAQPNIFNAFGLDYRYVEDGNDVLALERAFASVRDIDHPVVVHIHTTKGLGLPPSTDNTHERGTDNGRETPDAQISGDRPLDVAVKGSAQSTAYGISGGSDAHSMRNAANGSNAATGYIPANRTDADACDLSDAAPHEGRCEASHWQTPDALLNRPDDPRKHYGKMAMAALEARFAAEPGLVVISPATPGSNGITRAWRRRAGAHYVDTGITESHAVAFAAGIAKAGGTPVVATTASFFQRAYDQFVEELAINRLPVTVLVFFGGISGTDITHSGALDIPMLGNIPGLTCLAPTSGDAFLADLTWATSPDRRGSDVPGPVIIRVPGERVLARDRALAGNDDGTSSASCLAYRTAHHGSQVALLGLGDAYPLACAAADLLHTRAGLDATLIDPRQYSSLDTDALEALRSEHRLIVTLEDGQLDGGWGEQVTAWYANHRDAAPERNPQLLNIGGAKAFTDRVPLPELEQRYGMAPGAVVDAIVARLG